MNIDETNVVLLTTNVDPKSSSCNDFACVYLILTLAEGLGNRDSDTSSSICNPETSKMVVTGPSTAHGLDVTGFPMNLLTANNIMVSKQLVESGKLAIDPIVVSAQSTKKRVSIP